VSRDGAHRPITVQTDGRTSPLPAQSKTSSRHPPTYGARSTASAPNPKDTQASTNPQTYASESAPPGKHTEPRSTRHPHQNKPPQEPQTGPPPSAYRATSSSPPPTFPSNPPLSPEQPTTNN
jgi:hypothetical protein